MFLLHRCIRSYFSYNIKELRKLFPSNATLLAFALASSFTWFIHLLTAHFQLAFSTAAAADITASAIGVLGLILVIKRTEVEVWQSIVGRKLAGKSD